MEAKIWDVLLPIEECLRPTSGASNRNIEAIISANHRIEDLAELLNDNKDPVQSWETEMSNLLAETTPEVPLKNNPPLINALLLVAYSRITEPSDWRGFPAAEFMKKILTPEAKTKFLLVEQLLKGSNHDHSTMQFDKLQPILNKEGSTVSNSDLSLLKLQSLQLIDLKELKEGISKLAHIMRISYLCSNTHISARTESALGILNSSMTSIGILVGLIGASTTETDSDSGRRSVVSQ
jgi:hypothetical protein